MDGNKNLGRLIIFIFLGLILGGIFGQVLGTVLGQLGEMTGGSADNVVRNFFVASFNPSIGINNSDVIDLYFLKLRFGIGFNFNVCSLLGVVTSLWIMKWSK